LTHSVEIPPITQIRFDQCGTHKGLLRGELIYIDVSMLHLREFVDATWRPFYFCRPIPLANGFPMPRLVSLLLIPVLDGVFRAGSGIGGGASMLSLVASRLIASSNIPDLDKPNFAARRSSSTVPSGDKVTFVRCFMRILYMYSCTDVSSMLSYVLQAIYTVAMIVALQWLQTGLSIRIVDLLRGCAVWV
jgi:hypothetical protein